MNGEETDYYGNPIDDGAYGDYGTKPVTNFDSGRPPPSKPSPNTDPWIKRYRKMFIIPFILLVISVLIMSIANYLDPPDEDDYDDDDHEKWQKDMKDFNDTVDDFQNTADMVFTIGILVLAFLFFMGAFADKQLPISVKITMMILGVAIISIFLADGIKLQALIG